MAWGTRSQNRDYLDYRSQVSEYSTQHLTGLFSPPLQDDLSTAKSPTKSIDAWYLSFTITTCGLHHLIWCKAIKILCPRMVTSLQLQEYPTPSEFELRVLLLHDIAEIDLTIRIGNRQSKRTIKPTHVINKYKWERNSYNPRVVFPLHQNANNSNLLRIKFKLSTFFKNLWASPMLLFCLMMSERNEIISAL